MAIELHSIYKFLSLVTIGSMALVVFPCVLSFSFLGSPSSSPKTRVHSSASSSIKMEAQKRTSSEVNNAGAAVVWFKHDLRADDHPGLVAASRYRTVVPLYVFDRRILSRFCDEILELILFAVEDLRKLLKDQGSNLMIRFGTAENVIRQLVEEVKATSIFAEEEVECDLCTMMDLVEETLGAMSFPEGSPRIVPWTAPLYDIGDLKNMPTSHHDFQKLKFPVIPPVLIPKLPNLEMDLTWGCLPTLDDLQSFMNDKSGKLKDNWSSIKYTSAENILQKGLNVPSNNMIDDWGLPKSVDGKLNNLNCKHAQRKGPNNSAFVTQRGNFVGGGTSVVLNALAAYLRYLEGTIRDDWQEVHEKLRNAESHEGASFTALFGPALCLGIISRRRIHYEAIKYERERNAGFLSPFGYSAAVVAAAVDTACSMEWFWLMASKSRMNVEGTYSIRIWRWKGHLIQYTVVGDEGPSVLLVHGFGAFLEHYRDNIDSVAEGGNQVWAITLLGFGRSEKPKIVYTELMWAELLRDFIIEVVGEPVHLVGNSLGGYFVAIVAGLWPALAKSVVLINAAGNVVPGYSSIQVLKERQTSGAAWLGARFLLLYLKLRIRNIVKNFYPTRTERADDWLVNEMLRASYDPGVVVVLESIFSFNLSIPLNYLLEGFEGKVLVIQGVKDPLDDSKSKLAMLREHFKGIVIRELDAGHCPHDEQPEEVNSIVQEWVVAMENKIVSVDRM